MKRLILMAAGALLAACATFSPVTLSGGPDTALSRQVQRIADRHDAYVQADASLEEAVQDFYLSDSAAARGVSYQESVSPQMLSSSLTPVLDRHDVYVQADAGLDPFYAETYLASSQTLRDLLETAGAIE
jgi:hypothetical protein